MLTFLKLGGSLITDKREAQHFHAGVMQRAAQEIARARAAQPDLKLLIGHGSGSYGHVTAQQYGTMDGVQTTEQWRGFAEVAAVARALNTLVLDTLRGAGLPVLDFQPSASAQCEDGTLTVLATDPIRCALERDLVPLVYGDVAFDGRRGGTIISTEAVFFFMARRLRPARIMLLGEVEGVLGPDGQVIPLITPANLDALTASLGGSHGTDVTGGMASKVRQMVELVEQVNGLEVRIFGGTQPGQIEAALLGQTQPGTLIRTEG